MYYAIAGTTASYEESGDTDRDEENDAEPESGSTLIVVAEMLEPEHLEPGSTLICRRNKNIVLFL